LLAINIVDPLTLTRLKIKIVKVSIIYNKKINDICFLVKFKLKKKFQSEKYHGLGSELSFFFFTRTVLYQIIQRKLLMKMKSRMSEFTVQLIPSLLPLVYTLTDKDNDLLNLNKRWMDEN
jgi:hypothetical protein